MSLWSISNNADNMPLNHNILLKSLIHCNARVFSSNHNVSRATKTIKTITLPNYKKNRQKNCISVNNSNKNVLLFRLRWPWYIGAHLGENKAKLIIKKIARETVIHMKNSYAERLWSAFQLHTRLWLSSIVCVIQY